jgi:hypothetical protein
MSKKDLDIENKESLVKVNKERELPEIEKVDIETYASDVRRYQNSLVMSKDGLPQDLMNHDLPSIFQVLYFLDRDMVNQFTGKRTFNNLVESYMISGAYTEAFLKEHFKVIEEQTEILDKSGNVIDVIIKTKYEHDVKVYKRIELEAMANWKMKQLNLLVYSTFYEKLGGVEIETLAEMDIVNNALFNENPIRKAQYMRMLIDIKGMKENEKRAVENIFKLGGRELIGVVADGSDTEFLK